MTRRERLVVEHLEDISRQVLETYPQVIKELIRGKPGVYALYSKGKLQYVGLASNLLLRLRQHRNDRHGRSWDRFSVFLTVHGQHSKELESLILRMVGPKGNSRGGKFIDSKNLGAIVNKRIKNADDDRRALLLGGQVARQRRRAKSKSKRGSLVLAGVIDRRTSLRATYKGYEYRASLRRDGTISFGGKLYNSPSAAARAAVKRNVSGWGFWRYKEKGEWVRLGKIRK